MTTRPPGGRFGGRHARSPGRNGGRAEGPFPPSDRRASAETRSEPSRHAGRGRRTGVALRRPDFEGGDHVPQGVPALGPAPPAPTADSHAPALRLLVETKPRGRGPGRMAEASRAAHARLPSTSLLCVTRFLPSRSPQGPRWLLDLWPSLLCSPQEGGEKRTVKGESFRGINCIGHTCSHEGTPSCKGAWKTSLFPGGGYLSQANLWICK